MLFSKKAFIIFVSIISLVAFQPAFIANGQIQEAESTALFHPLPFENAELGRNSYAYLGRIQATTQQERETFVNQITQYGIEASNTYGMPASAIIGMAIIESGYGTTRTAYFANNLFGIKVWGMNPANAWQLKGQPDEDFDKAIPVLANYGSDRIVFDETERRDNWYRTFDSYQHSVEYLTGTLLTNQRYGFAIANYETRIANGWDVRDASNQYLYDVANAGYNHLGGEYYRNAVSNLMTQWDLYRHDVRESVTETETTPIVGTYHTVISGDTLWKLSVAYGTTVDAIKSANQLTSDVLFIGQVLLIPVNQPITEPIIEEPIAEPQPIVVEEFSTETVVEKTRGNGNGGSKKK